MWKNNRTKSICCVTRVLLVNIDEPKIHFCVIASSAIYKMWRDNSCGQFANPSAVTLTPGPMQDNMSAMDLQREKDLISRKRDLLEREWNILDIERTMLQSNTNGFYTDLIRSVCFPSSARTNWTLLPEFDSAKNEGLTPSKIVKRVDSVGQLTVPN